MLKAKLAFFKGGMTPYCKTLPLSLQEKKNSPLALVQCQKSTRHEENSREALIKLIFIVKSSYPKTSTYSLIQRHSHHIKLPVPEIKQSLLSDNPAQKHILAPVSIKISVTFGSFTSTIRVRMAIAALTSPYCNLPFFALSRCC